MADLGNLPFRFVMVQTGCVGVLRAISSVREASEWLLADWPEEGRGDAYQVALDACLAALAGKIQPDDARAAFIDAAQEAGIFVREGRRRR